MAAEKEGRKKTDGDEWISQYPSREGLFKKTFGDLVIDTTTTISITHQAVPYNRVSSSVCVCVWGRD